MYKRLISLHILLIAAGLRLPAQPQSSTNIVIGSSCMEVLGVDCTKDPQQANLWYDAMAAVNNRKVAGNQTAIVQQFLIPAMRRMPGMQAGTVDRAYRALGRTAGSAEESQWMAKFESWQTYQRLVPMIRQMTPAAAPVAPNLPQYTQAQQQQALQAAFLKVWGRTPTAAEAARFMNVSPANMESSVRGSLMNYPGEAPRIVDSVMAGVIGRQPTPYERSGVIAKFAVYWSSADTLNTYLRQVAASFRVPNYGPGGASPAVTAPVPARTGIPAVSGPPVRVVGATNSSGHIISDNGGGVVSTNGSNAASSNVVSHDGGSLVAQGAGNLVAQGAGNLVAQGAGNYHVESVGGKTPVQTPVQSLTMQQKADAGDGSSMVSLSRAASASGNYAIAYQWLYLASFHQAGISPLPKFQSELSSLWARMNAEQRNQAAGGIGAWKNTHPGK